MNNYLGGVLYGKGQLLLDLQKKTGINAAFLAAIAKNESANGTSYNAKHRNNIAGIRVPGSIRFRRYESVDDCLNDLANLLKNKYIDQGRTTIGSIGAKYCPVNDPTDTNNINQFWFRNVGKFMAQIDNNCKGLSLAV